MKLGIGAEHGNGIGDGCAHVADEQNNARQSTLHEAGRVS
jgi:hypothetical protein